LRRASPLIAFSPPLIAFSPVIRIQGHTALWLALGLDDQSFARTLVERGCDINLVSSTGDTMLHDAIRYDFRGGLL
jgi:ankyrin repeat protein